MRINLCSDLHLEFGDLEMPGGDVLIIAGDACERRSIMKYQRCQDFFEIECAKYNQVFMVMGNHEHYHHRFDKTLEDLRELMPANVRILENENVLHEGVLILGATLWTNLNNGCHHTAWQLRRNLNDFKVITNKYADGSYNKLTPEFTGQVHKSTVAYFESELAKNKDQKTLVITHHAPSLKSVHERYKSAHLMNGGYASDLSELILDNPQIAVWCHGHMHDPFDYMVGSTRVLCNPRGYCGVEDTGRFSPAYGFDL